MSEEEDFSDLDQQDPVSVARYKNKLAQKRYRDRQRVKKSNLFSQLAALQKKLATVESEHDQLEAKNRSLEEMTAGMKKDAAVLQKLEEARKEKPKVEPQRNLVLNWNVCFAEFVNATRNYEKPLLLPKQTEGFQVTVPNLKSCRINAGHSIGKILEPLPAGSPQAEKEVENYMRNLRAKKEAVMHCYCSSFSTCKTRRPFHEGAVEHDPMLPCLVATMRLTVDQENALLEARKVYEEKTRDLRIVRETLTRDLIQDVSAERNPTETLHSIPAALHHAQELEKNLYAEATCFLELTIACNNIVTPMQEAVALLEGVRLDAWFELWDIPHYLQQLQVKKLAQACSQHLGQIAAPTSTQATDSQAAELQNESTQKSTAVMRPFTSLGSSCSDASIRLYFWNLRNDSSSPDLERLLKQAYDSTEHRGGLDLGAAQSISPPK